MSVHEPETYAPVKVQAHITGSDVPIGSHRRKRLFCRFFTVVLTSTKTYDELVPQDDKRLYALVQAGGNNAVITESASNAQAGANTAAGQPNPIGMVLPAGNTVPTKIPGGQQLFCAAAAYPTQVTVCVVSEAD